MWFMDRAFRGGHWEVRIPVPNISQENDEGILIIKYQSAA